MPYTWPMMPDHARDRPRRASLPTGVAAVIAFLLVASAIALWRSGLWAMYGDREAFGRLLHDYGRWGPLAIIIAEILQVLLAPVPGQVVGVIAGYMYGPVWGTVLCMIGLSLGTLLAIWLARLLGRPLVERLASRHGERSQALIERIDNYARRRGALAVFLIFLLPFLPDDVVCFIAGLTPLRISGLLVLAIIGRAPGVIVSALIGAQAESITWTQLGLIALVAVVFAALFARYREELERVMFRLVDSLSQVDQGT